MNRDIINVQPMQGSLLLLTFEGNPPERRVVDISELVRFEGVFERLRDSAYFGSVRVNPEAGTIVWPNGADLCPDVLYERSRAASSAGAA